MFTCVLVVVVAIHRVHSIAVLVELVRNPCLLALGAGADLYFAVIAIMKYAIELVSAELWNDLRSPMRWEGWVFLDPFIIDEIEVWKHPSCALAAA